jgi:hypothetical protein
MEITFKEVEVTKLNLQPGEILVATIKSDDVDMASLTTLRGQIQMAFPNNKVFLFGISLDDEVRFSIMKDSTPSCGTQSYCADCNCGKKEQMEGK